MRMLVLVERVSSENYRARSGEPLVLTAEGATRDEALRTLHDLVRVKLCSGAELTEFTIPVTEARSRLPGPIYGSDDPDVLAWIEAMKENRRKADEDPDYL